MSLQRENLVRTTRGRPFSGGVQSTALSGRCSVAHHLLPHTPEPVALAIEDDHLGVVNQTINLGGDRGSIAEDLLRVNTG
ncbi:MAG: hypothetical protein ACT4OP_10590 [Actinomycetota bacterium]